MNTQPLATGLRLVINATDLAIKKTLGVDSKVANAFDHDRVADKLVKHAKKGK